MFGAIEAGGTKFVCAVGQWPDQIAAMRRIETRSPDETLSEVVEFFRGFALDALGVGTFGPVELEPGQDYGRLLGTPKQGWSGFPLGERLGQGLEVPVGIDTDVNAAALGEYRWGAARGCAVVLYVTVGTGVGGGVVVDGRPLHGLMHPEIGHLAVPAALTADGKPDRFPGVCRFHGRCLEGLVSGPALRARTGVSGEHLAEPDPVWDLTAQYLGQGLATAVLCLSPHRVVLGGGVGSAVHLLPRVRGAFLEAIQGYVPRKELTASKIDQYLVAPGLAEHSGIAGAFALAENCWRRANRP